VTNGLTRTKKITASTRRSNNFKRQNY
jgi:hypothetical protein